MANDGTISSKLQLDGEQQYKKALSEAYRSLRVLRSELKAETAEMGRNASAQDKARAKMASLQKQIEQQQKVVKTLEKALAESKQEYADNQEVQDKWAEKLNKAREALANMQNQMGECQDSLKEFSSGMKEVADNSGQAMTTVISFNDAMRSIGSIASGIGESLSGIFSATVDTMRDMVEEMFSLMSMAWSAASDWKDIQAVWGGSLEDIEKVYKGMEMQGIDAGTVTGAMQKLVANIHGGSDGVKDALKELGVQESDFSSHFDMFVKIMDELSNHTRSTSEKHNLAAALFGEKKGSDVLLMLDKWSTGLNQYQKNIEETGLALSSPEIDALELVAQKIQNIQVLWDQVKTNIGAKLSEILNMDQLSEDALNILRDIGALISGQGDKKEIVFKLEQDLQSLLTTISKALGNLSDFLKELGGDLEQSKNPLVSFVGLLIKSLGGILDWISQNSDTIISWLNKLLPIMAANKVSEAVTGKGIGDWITDIVKIGTEFAILGKVFGQNAGAAIGATAATFGSGIGAALLRAIPVLAGVDAMLNPDNPPMNGSRDINYVGEFYDENGNPHPWALKEGYVDQNGNLTDKAFYQEPVKIEVPESQAESQAESWSPIGATEEQRQAAEAFWDAWRTDGGTDLDALLAAFNGQEDIVRTLTEMMMDLGEKENGKGWDTFEDLPASWFTEISASLKNLAQEKYKGEADENLPGRIATAVAGAVKGIPINVSVYVDGEVVTRTVNQNLGGQLSALLG